MEKYPTKGKYILDGHEVKMCNDLFEWAEWYEVASLSGLTVVKQTILPGRVKISTVFLSIDYTFLFGSQGQPSLFETMIFGGEHNGKQIKHSATWEDAERVHEEIIQKYGLSHKVN